MIADLSVNHVERFILRCGYTVQRMDSDYGYDLIMVTYNEVGEIENDLVFFQLKATDNLKKRLDNQGIVHTAKQNDLALWCRERLPVIFVVYDATEDIAYWLHIQGVLSSETLSVKQESISLTLPMSNTISEEAIRTIRLLKPSLH
jgi:hypothetical protein